MERKDIEDGDITSSLLAKENLDTNGVSSSRNVAANSGGAATAMVVFSTFIAVCGSYVFGAAIGYSSPAMSGIMEDLGISLAQFSVFGSVMTIGAMLGATFSGKIADLLGCRWAMGLSEISCVVGWLAIMFSKGAWSLDLGRLLIGCGVGVLSYVVPVYIAEITPKRLRGGFTTAHQFMLSVGLALTYFIGTVVNWRTLALIGTIPSLVQLVGLFFIPESPRWLVKFGEEKDYEASLRHLRGEDADIFQEATEIREYTEALQQLPQGRFLDLFQRIYAHSLIVGVGIMILQQFGGANGIVFYASSIFKLAGIERFLNISLYIGVTILGKHNTKTLYHFFIAGFSTEIPTSILSVIIMDKAGRKPLLMVSAVGTCLGCLITGLSFLLQDYQLWKEVTPVLVFVGTLVYNGSFGLGLAGIPWLIMSEIFPINMKGSAGSLVSLVNWFSSWIVSYIFNFLMEWSSAGTFFIFASISGLTVLFVAKLVPETKGQTLEEIQTTMNPRSTR
ncbi:sugar transporter ERD6-like 5 isoform X3 [Quercus lobata]|uniref:sugar transporter ERD6-like 5 isoform X3 n=1 Tax=Quercus lobata TaxID=97700 RepID=UPI001243A430|nr:sugar transporter ERD6-like 5 isoform X3 [Quercus lobata]